MDKNNLQKIIALRHELHKNAELSLKENKTRKLLMAFLAENTKLHIVDRGRWFYAEYRSDCPAAENLLFRADFDALPISEIIPLPYASVTAGVSHKCGHDGHSAALAGLALEMDAHGADRNLCLVFQHAEEIGAGGEECAALIDEKHISRVYALHNRSGWPENAIIVKDGMTQCASEGIELRFVGRAAHASQPETGVNPAAAVSELVLYASTLTQQELFGDQVLCTVTCVNVGSRCFGIAAGEGSVCLVVRANREADMHRLDGLIHSKAAGLCRKYGLGLEHAIHEYFPETRNDSRAVNSIKRAAAELGRQVIDMPEPWRASEDFGYYTKKCPGAMFYVGNGINYPHVHTVDYDFNDNILETCVDMFCRLSRAEQTGE